MFINKPKCIWTGVANCALIMLYTVVLTALVNIGANAFSDALIKSDCNYAERTLNTLEHNKSRFGYQEYKEARKPHEEFIQYNCN